MCVCERESKGCKCTVSALGLTKNITMRTKTCEGNDHAMTRHTIPCI